MKRLFPLRQPDSVEERDRRLMEMALRLAEEAFEQGEVPVGALVVRGNELLGAAANQVEKLADATAHAEMLALTQAFAAAGEKRLVDCELICTLEPCIQCAGALVHARVARVVYGAADPKFGGVESLLRVFDTPGLNHRVAAIGGVLGTESAELLRRFFQSRRG